MEITAASPYITKREKEILALVAEGYTSSSIANKLYLSIRTVENHRMNILKKLSAKNTATMIKRAQEENLLVH
ncbi:regulatory protein, luxR family [Filimonas lacunae]|uniref:Regulatory protein, luxR family n=1 Tax=Filimonas lacunae TaxID=477680 RepID=A0A173MFU2_9BACT|nr:helix-turn-helix transcriptional regulator [Filimonas lacunae]BAV06494.1 two-component transcriptional regulator, LuxR family [Filimonas lacunae]SIT27159.1 regulatory protein, luxR family [Filimonas lacunae]